MSFASAAGLPAAVTQNATRRQGLGKLRARQKNIRPTDYRYQYEHIESKGRENPGPRINDSSPILGVDATLSLQSRFSAASGSNLTILQYRNAVTIDDSVQEPAFATTNSNLHRARNPPTSFEHTDTEYPEDSDAAAGSYHYYDLPDDVHVDAASQPVHGGTLYPPQELQPSLSRTNDTAPAPWSTDPNPTQNRQEPFVHGPPAPSALPPIVSDYSPQGISTSPQWPTTANTYLPTPAPQLPSPPPPSRPRPPRRKPMTSSEFLMQHVPQLLAREVEGREATERKKVSAAGAGAAAAAAAAAAGAAGVTSKVEAGAVAVTKGPQRRRSRRKCTIAADVEAAAGASDGAAANSAAVAVDSAASTFGGGGDVVSGGDACLTQTAPSSTDGSRKGRGRGRAARSFNNSSSSDVPFTQEPMLPSNSLTPPLPPSPPPPTPRPASTTSTNPLRLVLCSTLPADFNAARPLEQQLDEGWYGTLPDGMKQLRAMVGEEGRRIGKKGSANVGVGGLIFAVAAQRKKLFSAASLVGSVAGYGWNTVDDAVRAVGTAVGGDLHLNVTNREGEGVDEGEGDLLRMSPQPMTPEEKAAFWAALADDGDTSVLDDPRGIPLLFAVRQTEPYGDAEVYELPDLGLGPMDAATWAAWGAMAGDGSDIDCSDGDGDSGIGDREREGSGVGGCEQRRAGSSRPPVWMEVSAAQRKSFALCGSTRDDVWHSFEVQVGRGYSHSSDRTLHPCALTCGGRVYVNPRHQDDLLDFLADPSRADITAHLTNIALLRRGSTVAAARAVVAAADMAAATSIVAAASGGRRPRPRKVAPYYPPLRCHRLLTQRWGEAGLAHVGWGLRDTLAHVKEVRGNPAGAISKYVVAWEWEGVRGLRDEQEGRVSR